MLRNEGTLRREPTYELMEEKSLLPAARGLRVREGGTTNCKDIETRVVCRSNADQERPMIS
jgi:hypothetical protein